MRWISIHGRDWLYHNDNNFKKIYSWDLDDKCIELWSKEDTNIKKFNQHAILKKYSIKLNVNNKSIFFFRNKEQFINLDTYITSQRFIMSIRTIPSLRDLEQESNNNENTMESNKNAVAFPNSDNKPNK